MDELSMQSSYATLPTVAPSSSLHCAPIHSGPISLRQLRPPAGSLYNVQSISQCSIISLGRFTAGFKICLTRACTSVPAISVQAMPSHVTHAAPSVCILHTTYCVCMYIKASLILPVCAENHPMQTSPRGGRGTCGATEQPPGEKLIIFILNRSNLCSWRQIKDVTEWAFSLHEPAWLLRQFRVNARMTNDFGRSAVVITLCGRSYAGQS